MIVVKLFCMAQLLIGLVSIIAIADSQPTVTLIQIFPELSGGFRLTFEVNNKETRILDNDGIATLATLNQFLKQVEGEKFENRWKILLPILKTALKKAPREHEHKPSFKASMQELSSISDKVDGAPPKEIHDLISQWLAKYTPQRVYAGTRETLRDTTYGGHDFYIYSLDQKKRPVAWAISGGGGKEHSTLAGDIELVARNFKRVNEYPAPHQQNLRTLDVNRHLKK